MARRYYWKSLYLDRFERRGRLNACSSSRRPVHHRCRPSMSGNSAARWRALAPDATAFGPRDAPYLLGV